ncbi:MAG: type II secretion system protein GspD [Phycisphaerales bacterium]
MVRPPHLLTLPLVLVACAGTCMAQDKPSEPPAPEQPKELKVTRPKQPEPEPGRDEKKEEKPKDEKQDPAKQPETPPAPVMPAPTPVPPAPVPGPEMGPTPGAQPGANSPNAKPVVAPSEPGAEPKSIDSPVASDMVRLGPFTDEVDVKLLVKLVQEELKIQIISTDQALRDKKVSLMPNAIEIKRSELLPFLQLLLEQNGQILTRDVGNIWIIRPQTELNSGKPGEDSSTTQVVSTLGLKPTSLQNAIQAAMRSAGGQQPAAGPIAYLDDLGVIVMTDTPRRIDAIKALIAKIASEQQNAEIVRFDLKYIAAPVARVRILELAGQFTRALAPNTGNDPNAAAMNQATTQPGANASPNTSNLAQRLIVNPQGNGLLFRGRPDERAFIEKLIPIVDMPNDLVPRYYDIPAAIIIAEQGSRQGLGELKIMRSLREGLTSSTGVVNPGQPGQQLASSSAITEIGGPCFIVDPEGRGFMYYGTPEQQDRLQLIVQQFRDAVKRDDVIYDFYKLKHASAPDTAEIIRGLIANQAVGGSSSLLPGGRNSTTQGRRPNAPVTANTNPATPSRSSTLGSTNELGEIVASDDIFVQADERNNQLIVKAPRRLQPQFARLIEKLDLRRAQVYLDCKIVVVTDTDESRIAVETQLLNANGTGGALRTLFPNSAMPLPPNSITQFPVIVPALGGATGAIIKTGSVAATIIAIANTTDARIVASPQLLVDDNEEAEVASLEQRPSATTTQSGQAGSTEIGFGGYEDAGPKLKVKPRISTGNSLSINYEIELSAFVGDPPSPNVPPAKQKNNIKSASVTLPSDSTLVVGGLSFEQKTKTVFKVPLLGDIPIIGQAFRDERVSNNKRTFYVFITPRIMRDQGFDDLRLNTEGPASSVRVNDALPAPVPSTIPISPLPQPLRTPSGDQNGWNGPNLGYPESSPASTPARRTPGTSEPG